MKTQTNLIATTKIAGVSLFMLFVMTEKNSVSFLCWMVVMIRNVSLCNDSKRNTPELNKAAL